MNFLYFFVSFEILFLSNNHPAEAKSENALIYNYEDKKLIEARQPIALCQTCLTACPASTDPEKKFDDDDSIAGNSLFVRKISSNSQNEKNMKINICDRQFQPSIIWDDKKKMYLTGYELYYEYEEGQIKLQCDEYDNFRQITNGKPNEKQSPSSDFVRRYKSEGNTIFHILDEESIIEKLVFFWIHVLSIGQTEHVRQITLFERDEINYYKFDMIECEDYNLGGGWKTFVTKDDPHSPLDVPTSLISKLNSKNYNLSCKPDDCLQETPILPMLFFHTLASRLATCTYLNTAFIPKIIAKKQLKKVDQYLYTIRRIWPHTTNLHFGVSKGKNQEGIYLTYVINSQELFIPEIIFRVVQCIIAGGSYQALIVIHTDLTTEPDKDSRICPEFNELKGWKGIKNQNSETGFTYACPVTEDNIRNLQLPIIYSGLDLHLNKFPEYTGNPETPMIENDVTGKIDEKMRYFTEDLGILERI